MSSRTPKHKLIALSSALAIAVLVPATSTPSPASASTPSPREMSNGCTSSSRGIPSCGAYVGGAYGANADVRGWESSMGKHLGVHRTFWGSGSANSAARTAAADAAAHRVPWISFSAPYSWSDMAKGRGDSWAKNIAAKMKAVNGPVWVAVDHEPENDGGDIQTWKKMQEHLGPILRAGAPNLGFSIIVMGYHELYGAKKFALSAIWPSTKIDVVGYDVYEKYGVQKKGKPMTMEWKNMKGGYFPAFESWAKKTGVPWGLAETGYSDPAAKKDSTWMSRTYGYLKNSGGIAFSYFNTNLHGQAEWKLGLTTKKNAFTAINKTAPVIK